MSKKDDVVYVGQDDGHYAIKLVFMDGGKERMVSIPSRGKAGKHLIAWNNGSDTDAGGIYATEEGNYFTVNEHLSDCDDTRFRDYPVSELNRVLNHHALLAAGLEDREVVICTGLPVSYYYSAGAKNDVLIDGKAANLKKLVTSSNGRPCARIVRNSVATEAIAAYIDQLMTMDGDESAIHTQMVESMVGVVDVGGKTTDCAVILPGGSQVDTSRSGSSDVGVLKLNDQIGAALRTEFGFDNVPPRLIEQAISTGKVKIFGKEESVANIVLKGKEALADQIMATVRAKIGSGRELDEVLFVGGGTIVLRDQLSKHYPHCRFPEHPEFANARGMFKIAKYVFGQRQ